MPLHSSVAPGFRPGSDSSQSPSQAAKPSVSTSIHSADPEAVVVQPVADLGESRAIVGSSSAQSAHAFTPSSSPSTMSGSSSGGVPSQSVSTPSHLGLRRTSGGVVVRAVSGADQIAVFVRVDFIDVDCPIAVRVQPVAHFHASGRIAGSPSSQSAQASKPSASASPRSSPSVAPSQSLSTPSRGPPHPGRPSGHRRHSRPRENPSASTSSATSAKNAERPGRAPRKRREAGGSRRNPQRHDEASTHCGVRAFIGPGSPGSSPGSGTAPDLRLHRPGGRRAKNATRSHHRPTGTASGRRTRSGEIRARRSRSPTPPRAWARRPPSGVGTPNPRRTAHWAPRRRSPFLPPTTRGVPVGASPRNVPSKRRTAIRREHPLGPQRDPATACPCALLHESVTTKPQMEPTEFSVSGVGTTSVDELLPCARRRRRRGAPDPGRTSIRTVFRASTTHVRADSVGPHREVKRVDP